VFTRTRIWAIELCLSRRALARFRERGNSNEGEDGLSHSGKVRNAISITRCSLPRLALPAAWTAIP